MTKDDKPEFFRLLSTVAAGYEKELTQDLMTMWFEDLRRYDFEAVRLAFARHRQNPDNGQFWPKVADLVRMLGGRSVDSAALAWSKIERAIRTVGPYYDIVFDDPLIHVVIVEMGGWPKLCAVPSEHDLVFVGKDFTTRYQGYKMRSETPPHPRSLTGSASAANSAAGIPYDPVIRTVGDTGQCRAVYHAGGEPRALEVGFVPASTMQTLLPSNTSWSPKKVIELAKRK